MIMLFFFREWIIHYSFNIFVLIVKKHCLFFIHSFSIKMLQKIKNSSLKKEKFHCNFYSARLLLKIFSRWILINKTISKFVYLEKLFIYKVITFGQIRKKIHKFSTFLSNCNLFSFKSCIYHHIQTFNNNVISIWIPTTQTSTRNKKADIPEE